MKDQENENGIKIWDEPIKEDNLKKEDNIKT